MNPITNALTVDVEDYFQVAALAVPPSEWTRHELRVERNIDRLLAIFSEHQIRATFFVLGWVAERAPQVVRAIAGQGHEIACHGYSHQLIYHQVRDEFRSETLRAKTFLEDIIQQPILGYRAASYSITERSLWALDVLAEAGFRYDSSIFPVRHDRYGLPGATEFPHRLTTPGGYTLIEFPISTARLFGQILPASGGGYFRLYPYALSRAFLRQVNRRGWPAIFYLHPWEIDPQQPRLPAGWLSTFRHYNNLHKCEGRLRRLLEDFAFGTVEDVLERLDLPADVVAPPEKAMA